MTAYKQSKYAHVYRAATATRFFNSLTMELLEGDGADYEAWRSFERPRTPRRDDAAEAALVDAGMIVPLDTDERHGLLDHLTGLRQEHRESREARLSFLRISLTERCNLACSYCFVEEGIYKGQRKPTMDAESLTRHIEWLIDQNEGGVPTVQYFGGEPMLRMDLIKLSTALLDRAVEAGRIQSYSHTMTTNGTLVTAENARWLVDHRVDLTFSLDGWRQLNDEHRLFHNGRSSYDDVMTAIGHVREAGGDFCVLITLRPDTVELLPRIVQFVVEDLGGRRVAVNAPQPCARGWEVDGLLFARGVQESWLYCNERGVEFQSLGTHIVDLLDRRAPQPDRCFDGCPQGPRAEWGGYISADSKLSFCIVWHQDERCTTSTLEPLPMPRLKQWHYDTAADDDCDGCVAGLICGGPCALERMLNGGGLNPDRCKFFKAMVPFVLTQP